MTERPILFSSPEVRAILAGVKTQTRRIVKNPEDFGCFTGDCPHFHRDECENAIGNFGADHCPFGKPGDLLWVKEAWRTLAILDSFSPSGIPNLGLKPLRYEADGAINGPTEYPYGRYRHARFMPRAASRITLEVTGVSVERLKDISDADCFAEGIQQVVNEGLQSDGSARATYCALWESINGNGSWYANPWVWVIESHRIEQRRGL